MNISAGMASLGTGIEPIRDPHFDASENVLGTVNVLEAARASGVKRVIFASTAAAYGDVEEDVLPLQEQLPLAPMSFYGLTKVVAERYLALYQALYGLDYVVLRFANVYGERQGDKGEGGVISIVHALTTEHANTAYNLSTQTETSLNDLVATFGKAVGRELHPAHEAAREGDIYRSMLANEKAKASLHWQPEVSLEDGLRRTVAYFASAEL